METSTLASWKHYNDVIFNYEEKYSDYYTPWSGHKIFIYNLIRNIKPSKIVELGTHKGTSLFSMAQAIKDGNINCKLSGVDSWQGDINTGKYDSETVLDSVKTIVNKYYPSVDIHLMQMFFDEALAKTEDKSIDILHIDGLHTYEAVRNDFETWLPKVKDNGVILLHDIVVEREDFGVIKYWGELKLQYPIHFEFLHSFGLGVIIVGENLKELPSIFDKFHVSYLQYSYEKTKYEAYLGNGYRNEIISIKNSSFWRAKERLKKIIGR
jgi:hypothetical protein